MTKEQSFPAKNTASENKVQTAKVTDLQKDLFKLHLRIN